MLRAAITEKLAKAVVFEVIADSGRPRAEMGLAESPHYMETRIHAVARAVVGT